MKYIVVFIIIVIVIGYISNMVTLIGINKKRDEFQRHISTVDSVSRNINYKNYKPAYFDIGYAFPYLIEYKCGYSFGGLNAADKIDRSIYLFGVKIYVLEEIEICG